MALGKAQKQAKKRAPIIQAKLDVKILTDDFYDDFVNILDRKEKIPEKFKMFVYNHPLLFGTEQTKDRWLEWLDAKRDRNLKT